MYLKLKKYSFFLLLDELRLSIGSLFYFCYIKTLNISWLGFSKILSPYPTYYSPLTMTIMKTTRHTVIHFVTSN